ncbi:MAG TPA: TetR/AcrR family transcriptional regulator [Solirubrobacteraceae bacterium]|nr:TetR/AcrR family transcriptional regulator [Solirubrobacteraceae bacterium]
MSRRAESQLETRRRITESAVALHGTLGPAQTTMSAVAEHAGVRRSTLYRHFPDEGALFDACSAHWNAANPPPDLAAWATIDDPDERTRSALAELYGFYGRTAYMLENLLRDERTHAIVRERFGAFHGYLDAARDELLRGRGLRGAARGRVAAAIGHALALSTWRSLVSEQGLAPDAAVGLMCALIAEAQRGAGSSAKRRAAPSRALVAGAR